MNGYELALLENVERVRNKISRVVNNDMYYYSELIDLVNHQETVIKELLHHDTKLEAAETKRKNLNAQMLMNAAESGNRNYLAEIESLLSTIKELEAKVSFFTNRKKNTLRVVRERWGLLTNKCKELEIERDAWQASADHHYEEAFAYKTTIKELEDALFLAIKNKELAESTAREEHLRVYREELVKLPSRANDLQVKVKELKFTVKNLREEATMQIASSVKAFDRIKELENLFLLMYELGSCDPKIEDSVERTVAGIVNRQRREKDNDILKKR